MKTYILKNKKTGHNLSMRFDNLQEAIKCAKAIEMRGFITVTIWRNEDNELHQVIYK